MFSDRIVELLVNEALRKVIIPLPVELISSRELVMDTWELLDFFYCNRN